MKKCLFPLLLCLVLAGCGKPRHLTFEEQQAYMAQQQCAQEASDFNPDNPWGDNPFWNSYFVMCMHNLGISSAAINRIIWE